MFQYYIIYEFFWKNKLKRNQFSMFGCLVLDFFFNICFYCFAFFFSSLSHISLNIIFFLWFLFSWVLLLSTFCCSCILSNHHNYFPIFFTISNTIIIWFTFLYFYCCSSVIPFNSSSSLELCPIHYFFQGTCIYNTNVIVFWKFPYVILVYICGQNWIIPPAANTEQH